LGSKYAWKDERFDFYSSSLVTAVPMLVPMIAPRKTSAVLNATTGKIVATIKNGDGVDALGWDPAKKLIYIPAGRDSSVTIIHEDSPDNYSVVATVTTGTSAKTISVDTIKHVAYLF
jgi:hypothetical protein